MAVKLLSENSAAEPSIARLGNFILIAGYDYKCSAQLWRQTQKQRQMHEII